MAEKSDWGKMLREERAAPGLYGTYSALALAGAGVPLWLHWGDDRWKWLFTLLGLAWPLVLGGGLLILWGALGIVSLARHRLRFYEQGLYQGPSSGKGGVFLGWGEIQSLLVDALELPPPWGRLVGHYRVRGPGPDDEILLYPKQYRDILSIVSEIERSAGLQWTEIRLSR